MISILVASHGRLSEEIVKTSEMIAGKQAQISWLSLDPNDGIDSLQAKYNKALTVFTEHHDVLIFTDMWGGSPFEAAGRIVADNPEHIALIGGVNLPILLEAFVSRKTSLTNLVDHLMSVSKNAIRQFKLSENHEGI
ncbi:PTS sugar transporter subunit IIA [Lentilactobacillus sp. IMAU92037]|uniref:PTS sugar transporter subunit IIA n=1 Tax=Lentilactobacillus TaxID=2767893 RepID=UPI001C26ABC7|nr:MULTISPECIES: PTS sugar transporter subunit IIA [Lentilactobacillus]MBU9788619.1 PTS sugar transporter subunit IIA [Lentilactobacillus dabitei]MBV0930959.1 PTS sugar transporter subunit IIA [Lentilactobacillus dabitei]MDM7517036.1 PTS sugar transporter subunit IIA [Lentilactobacillus sp. TOM.63]